jgi:hypothetical protein
LLAMPRRRRIEGADPIMSDSQGVIFQYMYWASAGYERPRTDIAQGRLSQSRLPDLQSIVLNRMRHQADPAAMDSAVQAAAGDTTVYRVAYIAGDSGQFALSSTCQRYGESCLRSFFRDFAGAMHVTAEHRPATVQDPLVPQDGYDGARLPSDDAWTDVRPE